jgi:predicted nucleotidyltransferase
MWNFGYFNKTRFSVHPIRSEDEISNNYGLEKYIYVDLIKIRAEVKDISESMFIPAKYVIDNVEVLKGKNIDDIKQIISYEGLYCDILLKNEKIEAFGKLEKVINLKNTDKTYHRLVIGTFEADSRDYLVYEN